MAEADKSRRAMAGESTGGHVSWLRAAWQLIGPGLISGAADDDPTGIATYAQAGARAGYGLLWTVVVTWPMLVAVQFVAAKVAIVERKGLTGILKAHYPPAIVYCAVIGLMIANVINAGADLGALAAAVNLIIPIPIVILVVPITMVLLAFLVYGSYRLIENTFKWLTLALLAYIASAFLASPDWGAALRGTVVPHVQLNAAYLGLVVATLGGNVSPYLFFWQADLEVMDLDHQPIDERSAVRHARRGTLFGMAVSNSIIYFIEVATAATLFVAGRHDVTSAAQAARALRPLLGGAATYLWAAGMIGSGLLAVPALTGSMADAVSSLFGWPRGLDQPVHRARRFYLVLGAAMLVGMLVNFSGINPIRALVLSAALNGFLTPPLLILLVRISRNRAIMGDEASGGWLTGLLWATIVIMTIGALALLFTLV